MKLSSTAVQFFSIGLLSVPLLAQTQIGGGACTSSYLNGTYAVSISGRQVNAAGTFLSVFEANGYATFDGLNTVTISLTEQTNQAAGTSLSWSGTYSVQANCAAAANITSGGSATFNVMIYNQGKDFLLSGSDATYSYSGNGIAEPVQPASCSNSTLNGVYTFNGTGYVLSTNSVSGVEDGAGLLQFDGQGNLTVNLSTAASGSALSASTFSGSYTISANCTGSATLTDSNSHSLTMSLSIFNSAATNTNFYVTLAQAGGFLLSGTAHTDYAPPAAGTCVTSSLNGVYSLTLSGRGISGAGNFTGSFQGVGTATFDGNGNVTLAGTANTNLAQGNSFSYTGTYSLPSNCSGTLTVTTTSAATFGLVVWSSGAQFAAVGSDASYVYSASGGNPRPAACAAPTLSGTYTYTASGFTHSGTVQNGSQDEAGVLTFDGQSNVALTYTDSQGGATPVMNSASGTYTVSGCLASATVTDSSNNSTALNFAIAGLHGENLNLLAADADFVRTGSGHSAFMNPSQAIGNVASYAYSATPPGSVFALFGLNLATRPAGAVSTPLPQKLLNTSVTVNGEIVPLFYVDPQQIDAQMPWDIPGNTVASVIVTNGSSVSNAAAVYVPATGTPGISTFSNNRAVVVNANGSLNVPASPAKVGDEVVAYFTGGGPVMSQTDLVTGHPAGAGLAPVTGDNSVSVGGVAANVVYVGLTPGSIGLYQANFYVPQLANGAYPVVITIAGEASNNPVMNVVN